MKWIKSRYGCGDTKQVTKFLWWLMTIVNDRIVETRWLERATIEYTFRCFANVKHEVWYPGRFV